MLNIAEPDLAVGRAIVLDLAYAAVLQLDTAYAALAARHLGADVGEASLTSDGSGMLLGQGCFSDGKGPLGEVLGLDMLPLLAQQFGQIVQCD